MNYAPLQELYELIVGNKIDLMKGSFFFQAEEMGHDIDYENELYTYPGVVEDWEEVTMISRFSDQLTSYVNSVRDRLLNEILEEIRTELTQKGKRDIARLFIRNIEDLEAKWLNSSHYTKYNSIATALIALKNAYSFNWRLENKEDIKNRPLEEAKIYLFSFTNKVKSDDPVKTLFNELKSADLISCNLPEFKKCFKQNVPLKSSQTKVEVIQWKANSNKLNYLIRELVRLEKIEDDMQWETTIKWFIDKKGNPLKPHFRTNDDLTSDNLLDRIVKKI